MRYPDTINFLKWKRNQQYCKLTKNNFIIIQDSVIREKRERERSLLVHARVSEIRTRVKDTKKGKAAEEKGRRKLDLTEH